MNEAQILQKRLDGAVEIPPQYQDACACPGCRAPATHTVVLNLWAIDDLKPFRGKHNAVRMFPAIVACDKHKTALHEIGFHALERAVGYACELFKALSKEPPDLKDALIDVQTIDEAAKLWQEPKPLFYGGAAGGGMH